MSTKRFIFALKRSEMPFKMFGLIPPKSYCIDLSKDTPKLQSKERSFRTILKGMRGRNNFKTNIIIFSLSSY